MKYLQELVDVVLLLEVELELVEDPSQSQGSYEGTLQEIVDLHLEVLLVVDAFI